MHCDNLLICNEINSSIATITLNRPKAANALNNPLADAIAHAFTEIGQKSYRVAIITGAGKHFCAGADIKQRSGITEAQWQEQHHKLEKAHKAILHCPIPVIAAVEGAAYGGGLELALACDFIYASSTSRFALTEATLGIMPGMGGTQLLSRAVGLPRAKELLYSGKPFSANDALSWGMVNRVCSPESLWEETIACGNALSQNAPLSLRAIKQSLHEGAHLALIDALHCELQHYNTLLTTHDRHEGTNAFTEKRKPVFTGE